MGKTIVVKEHETPIYEIRIENSYAHFDEVLRQLKIAGHRVCIVSDTTISKYYMKDVVEIVKDYASLVETFTLQPGEEHKNLDSVQALYEYLIQSKFDRNDFLIALGGGVVGDLTGYVAATYLRGISFIQMPTTLLSMVDSSIGGKTGVDFAAYKNMVGAFKQPKAVYINTSVLETLTPRQFYSGFGEVTKYGYISDAPFDAWLQENVEKLIQKDSEALAHMIERSCNNKRVVVEEDPTEKGIRAILNFGHTLGHAIEKMMDFQLLHGECVAIGMVAAAYISQQRGMITEEQLQTIQNTLEQFQLPTKIKNLDEKTLIDITKNDKKMDAGKIKFILLDGIGHAVIDPTVTTDEMLAGFRYVVEKGE
ncbi:MAG: 3-dehydroquinate synthase [Lachnospiraceae bacterium]|nr:3-dehydroquinate synthase [Lachnospiraceae bacterium]